MMTKQVHTHTVTVNPQALSLAIHKLIGAQSPTTRPEVSDGLYVMARILDRISVGKSVTIMSIKARFGDKDDLPGVWMMGSNSNRIYVDPNVLSWTINELSKVVPIDSQAVNAAVAITCVYSAIQQGSAAHVQPVPQVS